MRDCNQTLKVISCNPYRSHGGVQTTDVSTSLQEVSQAFESYKPELIKDNSYLTYLNYEL